MLYKTIILWVLLQTMQSYSGYAAFYNPGVMERVARNRDMPIVSCMVASPHEELGTWIIIISQYNGRSAICRITDIAHPKDKQTIIDRGIIVELSWDVAGFLCGISKTRIEPPKACTVTIYK